MDLEGIQRPSLPTIGWGVPSSAPLGYAICASMALAFPVHSQTSFLK